MTRSLRYQIWILLFLLLTSCATNISHNWGKIGYWYTENTPYVQQGIRYNVFIDQSFNSTERNSLLKAVGHWNYVLNGQIQLRIIDFKPVNITNDPLEYWFLKVDNQCQGIIDIDTFYQENYIDATALAYTDDIGGNIIYFDMERITPRLLMGVAEHEIGHLLGAKHQPEDLMASNQSENEEVCIDRNTVFQVVNYFDLNWDKVNWCYFGQQIN